MQTEQLVRWSGMTATEHSTTTRSNVLSVLVWCRWICFRTSGYLSTT